jgi:predicted P-loop ATPase
MTIRTEPPFQHGDREITVGEDKSNLGETKCHQFTAADLAALLCSLVRDNVNHAVHLKLDKKEQDRRKNVSLWLDGRSRDGRRKNVSLERGDVVMLDLGETTPELIANLETKPVDMPSHESMLAFSEANEDTMPELLALNYDYSSMFEGLDENEPPAPSRVRSKKAGKSDPEETGPGANVDAAAGFENLDESEEDLDDDILELIGPAPKAVDTPKYDTLWLQDLELTQKGFIKSNLLNVGLILQNDPRIAGTIALNLFTNEIVTRKCLVTKMKTMSSPEIRDPVNGDLWSDYHNAALRRLLEAPNGPKGPEYGLKVSGRRLDAAIMNAAQKNAFHPVRDYLSNLTWDRVGRVSSVLIKYLGAADCAYVREACLKFFVAAVVRAFEPGHKFDFTLILRGSQGKQKSTFIKILARAWFAELKGDMYDRRRLVEQMQGAWVLEFTELSGMGRSDLNAMKEFISASSDKVRLTYARRSIELKRQCVIIGTTNKRRYLQDETGNRRFWMVHTEIDEIDTEGLEREIDQIWAEAVHMYREARVAQPCGELPLYLTNREVQVHARELQESRRVQTEIDAFVGMTESWLNTPTDLDRIDGVAAKFDDLDGGPAPKVLRTTVCLPEIWKECLAKDMRNYKRSDAVALGRIMRRLKAWVGNEKAVRTKRYGVQKVWRRLEAPAAQDDDLIG